MKLDVYRSCSRHEKRQVLEAFWHTNVESSSRIHDAALQYGPYAVACLVAVAAELIVVIVASLHRVSVISWIAVIVEAVVVLSLWWAVVRSRALRRQLA
jgi:Flp pilus assembly protein TadB